MNPTKNDDNAVAVHQISAMDFPQFLFHQREQSRYIPGPSPTPNPHPHPFFPDDSNFHFPPNHHQVLQNIPEKVLDFPLPPPPPPLSYRHLPVHSPALPAPPLGYNPARPQFIVSSSNHDNHLRDYARSPPVSNRISFDGGFHRELHDRNHTYHESRMDISDPSRVTADNRPPIPHSPIDIEHGPSHREIDHRPIMPYPPLDMFRYNSGNSSRRGAEYSDGFQTNPREEVLRGRREENYYHRDQFETDSNRSFMEHGAKIVQSPLSRENNFTSGSFDKHRYGSTYEKESFRSRRSSNGVCKNQRWVHNKQTFRNMHNSFLESGSNDRGHGDRSDFRTVSGKHGPNPELGKYYTDNKGSIDGYNEYTSTPRKQIQKKSAFLRIQAANPCNSNIESEELRDSDYFDEKNNGSLRSKNQVRSMGYRMDVGKKREGSPMELDVSFKSNSLVAKAIVAPTQSAPISDMDLMPRNVKLTNVSISHHDSPDSHLTRQNKDDVGTNGVTNLAPFPSGSNNLTEKRRNALKESKEKATGLLADNGSNNLTEASSVTRNHSLRKTKVERPSQGKVLDIQGRNVFGKASPIMAMKKKKVVRKVVKKVLTPQQCSQAGKSDDNPLKVGSLTHIPPVVTGSDKGLELSKNTTTASEMNSVHNSLLKASQHGMSGLLENKKASKECQAKTHMGKERVPANKSNKNSLDSSLNSLVKEGRGNSNHLKRNSSLIPMPPLLNSNKDLKLLNGPNEFAFKSGKFSKGRLCGIEDSLLENISGGESKATKSFLEGSQSGLLSSNAANPHDDLVNGNSLAGSVDIPMDLDNGETQFQDNTPISETCFVAGIGKQLCANKVTGSPETDIVGVLAAEVTISNSLVGVPNSEAAGMQIDSINFQGYNCDKHTNLDSDDCFQCTNIRLNEVLNCETLGNTREQEPVVRSSVSLGISSQERSPKAKVSTNRGKGGKLLSNMSGIGNCLDFAGSSDINQETNSEDPRISFNSKNHCPSEQDVFGLGRMVLDVNPTTAGDSAMPGSNLSGKSSKNNKRNEISPKSRKKQKTCIASPALPCPSAESNEGPAITFISSLRDQLTSNGEFVEGKEVAVSTLDTLSTASPVSTDCSKGINTMVNGILIKESTNKISIDNDPFEYSLNHDQPEKNSCSIQELIVSKCQSPYPSVLETEQKESGTPIMARNQRDDMTVDVSRRKELDVHAAQEQSMVCDKTAQWKNPSEVPSSQTLDCLYPVTEKTSDNLGQDNLHYLQNHIEIFANGNRGPTANSDNEILGSMFGIRGDLGSPETSSVPGMHKLNCEASPSHIDRKMDSADHKKAKEKSIVENERRASTDTPFSQSTTIGHTNAGNNLLAGKILPLALEESKNGLQAYNNSDNSCKKRPMSFNKPCTIPVKSFSTYTASKKLASAAYSAKPRSWHRNVNSLVPPPGNKSFSRTIPPQGQLNGGDGMLQSTTSYIRKGNSLVRKSSPVAAQVLGSHDLSSSASDQHDCRPSIISYSKVDLSNPPFHFKARGVDAPVDKPNPPPLSSGSGSPNHSIPMGDHAPSPCHESESYLMKTKHVSDLSRSVGDPSKILSAPKSHVGSADKKENLAEAKHKNSVSSVVKKIVYVKRKSNQLVATSNPCNLSTKNVDTGYYKRKKNQLIRASSECQIKATLLPTEDISTTGPQSSSGDGDFRNFNKRQLCKVKTHGPLKSSLVWTLRSSVAPGNGGINLQNHKIVPRLFPWKRSYWKTVKPNTSTHKNSSSSIVRKLLLLRNRNTVYERSKHGFSLRKSKVLSNGRSSLKWSKSIERHSKKANEEATRAVVDAERKKRARNWDASVCSEAQDGSQFSYDQASCSTTLQPKKSAKKLYIPRRLMIGNDEYVKIGKGNQLVRSPKRRARILANEKIRWSLHTARQRLAKKRKYCQFFTRFGKCDKGGGKCPYIHDISKIAVCTKFLKGLCSNPSCKLTHKVIPERMPDCSYFLQGLCSSKNCAYRHVNVNSKASTCEAFLRGYCALGNECRKKHSYVCPLFKATGTCHERSKCKLHHPKKQTNGRKRKRSGGGKNNDQGRYFSPKHIVVSGSRMVVTEKHPVKSTDPCPEGDLTDYISLDVSSDEEEIAESHDSTSQRTTLREGYLSESLLDDPDELLIKPVRIMYGNLTMQPLEN